LATPLLVALGLAMPVALRCRKLDGSQQHFAPPPTPWWRGFPFIAYRLMAATPTFANVGFLQAPKIAAVLAHWLELSRSAIS